MLRTFKICSALGSIMSACTVGLCSLPHRNMSLRYSSVILSSCLSGEPRGITMLEFREPLFYLIMVLKCKKNGADLIAAGSSNWCLYYWWFLFTFYCAQCMNFILGVCGTGLFSLWLQATFRNPGAQPRGSGQTYYAHWQRRKEHIKLWAWLHHVVLHWGLWARHDTELRRKHLSAVAEFSLSKPLACTLMYLPAQWHIPWLLS